jgi:cephalosporin-C deacetylase-like acetyl esterase
MSTLQILEDFAGLQLQKEIINRCRKCLKEGDLRRRSVSSKEEWEGIKNKYIKAIRGAFHPLLFNRSGKLKAEVVSEYERENYRIQNVLYESLPGWNVNASIYMPLKRGVYPCVICPTGHASKTFKSYQHSAQVFARNGYIAVSFDPPGCAGEMPEMNNHFTNGLIGYLTGAWSNFHFVLDAVRSIDYIQTRPDIDKNLGISITGVSGGGCTSIYTALIDKRISFLSPVCCLSSHEQLHFSDLYTSCPEQFGPGVMAEGIGYKDLITSLVPLPVLIVGGKLDEVFDYRHTENLYQEVRRIYRIYGSEDRIGLYIQENSGHGYTPEMAGEVVRWMNRFIRHKETAPEHLRENDLELVDPEMLKCRPNNKTNMYTFNRRLGRELRDERKNEKRKPSVGILRGRVGKLLGLEHSKFTRYVVSREKNAPVRWSHKLEKVAIHTREDTFVPGLLYSRVDIQKQKPGLLFIDEAGKWRGFKNGGFLSAAGRFTQRDDFPAEPVILSVDVSGVGELTPQPTAYDMAEWNDIERILTYLSVGASYPIMGLRIRDAMYSIAYLRSLKEVDAGNIVVAGRGVGAIVALHTAFLSGINCRLVLWDILCEYTAMTESFPFTWPQSIIIPGILSVYDLPDLLGYIRGEVLILNPLDAERNRITGASARKIYREKENIQVFTDKDEGEAVQKFIRFIHSIT